jgi:hypothetical protein
MPVSATSLIRCITVTATCTYRSIWPVPDVGEHIVAVVAWPGFVLDATFRMGDALVQCLSHSI